MNVEDIIGYHDFVSKEKCRDLKFRFLDLS